MITIVPFFFSFVKLKEPKHFNLLLIIHASIFADAPKIKKLESLSYLFPIVNYSLAKEGRCEILKDLLKCHLWLKGKELI